MYLKCQVDLWAHMVGKFIDTQSSWTHARLVDELQEGYRLLDQILSKRFILIIYI